MSMPSDPNAPRVFDALQIPPAALERGGVEVLRAGIIDDGLHVTLRPVFEDTRLWGRVLADIAFQVARAYAQQGRGSAEEAIANIRAAFDADMNNPPDVHSEVGPIS
jgi:hypothetical protein